MTPASPPKISVDTLFPTPLVSVLLPEATALCTDLKAAIEARRTADPVGVQHTNMGGWQSTADLAAWGGKAAATLLGHVRAIADRLTCDRATGTGVAVPWLVNAWANVNEGGQGNEFHAHPGSFWSGVFYVDDGGAFDDPALGGEFEIRDPRGILPAMVAPSLTVAMPGGAAMGLVQQVRPRMGMALLFPAWVDHGVRPYLGRRRRISVAFNLSPPAPSGPVSPAP